MTNQKRQKKEIDYLHPDGKPKSEAEGVKAVFSVEQWAEETAARNKAIEEVDGHHVCSKNCQAHHEVKAKGADKTKP